MYLDNKQYLLEELKILDILLYREVQKSRATRSKQDHQNNELLLGSVITDDEIDEILRSFTISKKRTEDADIDDGSPTVAIHDSDLFSSVEVDKKDLVTNSSQPFESQETDVSKKNDVIDASNNESGNVDNHHIEEKSLFNVKAIRSAVKSAAILSINNGIFLGLPILSRLFNLTSVDQLILLICLAPELDSKYSKLYAYLQDDLTKKRPTIDLIFRILCKDYIDRLYIIQQNLSHYFPLIKHNLVHILDDPMDNNKSTLSSKHIKLDDRITYFLMDIPFIDPNIQSCIEIIYQRNEADAEAEEKEVEVQSKGVTTQKDHSGSPMLISKLSKFIIHSRSNAKELHGVVIYLNNSTESERRKFAVSLCKKIDIPIVVIDLSEILTRRIPFEWAIKYAVREAILYSAALYLIAFDKLIHLDASYANAMIDRFADDYDDERSGSVNAKDIINNSNNSAYNTSLVKILERHIESLGSMFGGLTFISGDREWFPLSFANSVFIYHKFFTPDFIARKNIWIDLSNKYLCNLSKDVDLDFLANKFVFTSDKIEHALKYAKNIAILMSEDNNNTDGQDIQDKNAIIRMEDLYEACKLEVGKRNLSFAHIVKSNYRWDDLVLPLNTKEQLRDICNAIKHKRTVYESWGFEKRLSLGKGFNVLLSGPAGTGKTMAAEVIANELHLEMYKIDLSAIVSKWIGETERNLDKIFDYAREINVILFFDEADALFGKRTKVNDAHDRYANIETNYLLQKLEEYEGIVILSSNFRENIDDAFVRRLQHILEFRLPDENSRLEIWRNIFPKEAPISSDVNFMLLARKFKISGGSIKNVAVASAFLAAEDSSSPICMKHILKAMRREYVKIGRLPSDTEFNI